MEGKDYFQSFDDYFWQWEDNAEVLAIPGESTIAYYSFVSEVLHKLSSQGLPPFGSLLLAIIATNQEGRRSLDAVYNLMIMQLEVYHQSSAGNQTLTDCISFLKLLSEVPQKYKEGKRRILLLQAVFERCHNAVSSKHAEELLAYYSGIPDSLSPKATFKVGVLKKDIRTIALLNSQFSNVQSILDRIASLPDIPSELEVIPDIAPIRPAEKDFVELLIEHQKTFYVGSLVKRIWNGLQIPLHTNMPSSQPLGGISDLTNKGDFDKLLVSEFANDDLIFLSRLANNEALYLHREVPPVKNEFQRILLVDVSMKCWGTPKTIALAAMLAIAKHPKSRIGCTAYAIGNTFEQLTIDTVDGIIDAVQIVDSSLHPAEGLAAFIDTNALPAGTELFILTVADNLMHPSMLKALQGTKATIYWLSTSTSGDINMYRQQNGKKHLQHLQLQLADAWKNEKKTKNTPEYKQVGEFPILVRPGTDTKKILSASDGCIFLVTGDRMLLKQYGPSRKPGVKGWDIICTNLRHISGPLEIAYVSHREYVLLMFNTNNRKLTLLNTKTREEHITDFAYWTGTGEFIVHKQEFYYKDNNGIWSISLDGKIGRPGTGIAAVNGEISYKPHINRDIFTARETELNMLKQRHTSMLQVFKNLTNVFINQTGNLVLNVHELIINNGGHLKLDPTGFRRQEAEAKLEDKKFVFADGSSVEIAMGRIIILKSSDPELSPIYISSAIDAALGAATDDVFTGNEYYNKGMKNISTSIFYGKYIARFTKHILDNTPAR
ncbi:MAG: hypothetical protein EOO06_00205 [Chitinophagaceae bacterium]|nr:MAG: hypothetical protein EOO06_00205 [Chitinophagaceae bacterium]